MDDGASGVYGPRVSTVVVVGSLDGVHVGHAALLARAVTEAQTRGAAAVALTFDRHPSAVVGDGAPAQITSARRRNELLAAAGVRVHEEPFTPELAALSPADFVTQVLVRKLKAVAVVAGGDWRFGAGRLGDLTSVEAAGLAVLRVDDVQVAGERCSSTRVRAALAAGDLALTTALLGRAYDVDGVVVRGAARGRTLGFPTANVATDTQLLLPAGVYATWVLVNGRQYPSATSLGPNATFTPEGPMSFENYLLDFDGDLYGLPLRTTFVARLRPQVTFADVPALVAQVHQDVVATRAVLAGPSGQRAGQRAASSDTQGGA